MGLGGRRAVRGPARPHMETRAAGLRAQPDSGRVFDVFDESGLSMSSKLDM